MERFIIITAAIALTAVIAAAFFGCAAQNSVSDGSGTDRSYTRITQEQAKEMMKKDDGHIVVDVRRLDEYDEGHIPGAVCVPNESIDGAMPKELPDKGQIILVYCRSGRRSREAAQKLFDMGYENVYEFGGIIDWTGEIEVKNTGKTAEPTAALVIEFNGKRFYAALEDNPSAKAFIEKLDSAPISVDMRDYGGFEKVGDLPWELVRSDERITTVPGDVILYQGDRITIYYGENTWSFTRLARIENVTGKELLDALGEKNVTVKFYLEWSE